MENKVTADYLDEEGCLHCGICGKRKQMKVSLMGFEHVVSCLCECEVKARQELDEKMQREEAQRLLYHIIDLLQSKLGISFYSQFINNQQRIIHKILYNLVLICLIAGHFI